MKDQYGEISARVDGHVALLEIDRPPNNFVSVELMRELANALEDIDADRSLRASVLMSARQGVLRRGRPRLAHRRRRPGHGRHQPAL